MHGAVPHFVLVINPGIIFEPNHTLIYRHMPCLKLIMCIHYTPYKSNISIKTPNIQPLFYECPKKWTGILSHGPSHHMLDLFRIEIPDNSEVDDLYQQKGAKDKC